METNIKAKTIKDLFVESIVNNKTKVKVVFKPAFEDLKHLNITNVKLVESLKQNKISVFDVINESNDIIHLINNNKDIVSINFV